MAENEITSPTLDVAKRTNVWGRRERRTAAEVPFECSNAVSEEFGWSAVQRVDDYTSKRLVDLTAYGSIYKLHRLQFQHKLRFG
jgi:hypothetical protein